MDDIFEKHRIVFVIISVSLTDLTEVGIYYITMDEGGTVSLRICQDGHANSFALNKENTCIAVAGRSCK